MIGLSRLVLKSHLDNRQRDHIEKVLDAGESLLGLINDILDFSKIEAGKLSIENIEVSLGKMVRRSVNLCALNAHTKGLELITDLDCHIPQKILSDPLRLQQIIVNLVNNAVKFTETGAVCFKARIKEDRGDQLLLHCSVIDTGIGMTPEQQGRMFQSFSQADETVSRKHGGTGLGLAISKQLCELMGGEIWLESEVGVGSTFHFTILADKVADAESTKAFQLPSLKVLVVDDVALSAKVLQGFLNDMGARADWVDSGTVAMEKVLAAEQAGEPYDILLIDWLMPGLDGIATVVQLHQSMDKVPEQLLMVSTYDRDEAIAKAGQGRCQRMIEKPVDHQTLYNAITALLSGDEQAQDVDAEETLQAPDLSGFSVLLVDDNAINRQVAIGFLADTGMSVVTANHGGEALHKLEHGEYDMVLMDIEMPEMDGITATKAIREKLCLDKLPVIAMTAHATSDDAGVYRQAGMNDHIGKPFEPLKLYKLLTRWLDVENPKPVKADNQTRVVTPTAVVAEKPTGALEKLILVEGLDPQMALARMNGKTALYLDVVKDFGKRQGDLHESMQQMYEQQAWDELYRTVHSLKSNAAYIGAYQLSQVSESVENAYGLGKRDKALLDKLFEALDPLVNQLDGLFDDVDTTPVESNTNMVFDTALLRDMLTQLLPLLETSNIEVDDVLPQLQSLCAGTVYAEQVAEMVELVDDIEFEKAYEVAEQMLQTLDAESAS